MLIKLNWYYKIWNLNVLKNLLSIVLEWLVDASLGEELRILIVVKLISDCVLRLVVNSYERVPSCVVDFLFEV